MIAYHDGLKSSGPGMFAVILLTTGATATGCARALYAAGAKEVWLATVCVAVRDPDASRSVPPF